MYTNASELRTLSNITIRNIRLTNWYFGAFFAVTFSSTVRGVTANVNGDGVTVYASRDASVVQSEVSKNANAGLVLSKAANSSVTGIVANENRGEGIVLRNSYQIALTGNNANGNQISGISLFHTDNTTINNNTANSNTYFGIQVNANSHGTNIVNNTVISNGEDGIYILSGSNNTKLANNVDGTVTIQPTEDTIGREGGFWHDDSIAVDQSNGLTRDELVPYIYRTIARTEKLRNLEFKDELRVEIITREEYNRRESALAAQIRPNRRTPRDQTWDALFMNDQAAASSGETDSIYAYLDIMNDKIVMISDTAGFAFINESNLVHELTHELTDQHFDLRSTKQNAKTSDEFYAINGLIEGDAEYVKSEHEARCRDDWECVADPVEGVEDKGPGREVSFHEGIRVATVSQYVRGPDYIERVLQKGGWEAVNRMYERPPTATTQIIHPWQDERVRHQIEYEDRARGNWRSFSSDTVGEVGIYSMFWYQEWEYEIDLLEVNLSRATCFCKKYFNYVDPVSDGWENDRLVQYQNTNRAQGYVWVTEWTTPDDATRFYESYLRILQHHGAERRGTDAWVISDGEYADAFRIVRQGTTVTIVNAPFVEDLSDIRPLTESSTPDNRSSDREQVANVSLVN